MELLQLPYILLNFSIERCHTRTSTITSHYIRPLPRSEECWWPPARWWRQARTTWWRANDLVWTRNIQHEGILLWWIFHGNFSCLASITLITELLNRFDSHFIFINTSRIQNKKTNFFLLWWEDSDQYWDLWRMDFQISSSLCPS